MIRRIKFVIRCPFLAGAASREEIGTHSMIRE
jgi:hypothetical protein